MPWHLIFIVVLGHMGFSGARLALSLQALRLGANSLEVGVIMGLMSASAVLISMRMGRWADCVGFGPPAVCGLLVLVTGSAVGAAAARLGPLYLASLLVGGGYLALHVVGSIAVGQAAAEGRVTAAFSALTAGFSISAMTAPLLAGSLMDRAGTGAAFLASAGWAVIGLGWLLVRWRHAPQPRGRTIRAGGGGAWELLFDPRLREVFIASSLLSVGWDLFLFLAPLHGTHVGLSGTAVGLLMTAFSIGTLTVRSALPWIERHWTSWTIVIGVLAVTATTYVVFPLLSTLAWLLPATFAMGASLGCAQPLSMALLHRAAPPERAGEAMGARSALASGSQTFLPMVFGGIGASLGVAAIFWSTAVVLAGGAAYVRRRVGRVEG